MNIFKSTFFTLIFTIPFLSIAANPDNKENFDEELSASSFVSFETIINGERIDLKWETMDENNVNNFIIEKSKDGLIFESVFNIKASQKWSAYMNYLNVDFNVWEGKTFYRITQIDNNGKRFSSNIVTVVYNGINGERIEHQHIENVESSISLDGLLNTAVDQSSMGDEILVIVRNRKGEELYSKINVASQNGDFFTAFDFYNTIPVGKYLVVGSEDDRLFGKKLRIRN